MSDDPIRAEAKRRHELHVSHPTHRPLSDNYELVGLRTEEEFARVFGTVVDLTSRPGGDGGIDFRLPFLVNDKVLRFKIDTKGARKAFNLIVEVGEVEPETIYVLGHYSDEKDRTEFLGWQWGKIVLRAPTKDFGYGVINHYIPAGKLRKMEELIARRAWRRRP